MNDITGNTGLNRVEKRAIEALAIAPIIRLLSEKIGREQALALVQKVNEREAFQRGKEMTNSGGQNGIAALVDEVATWGEGGVWETDILEQTSTTYFFNVTRCPYYDKYKELGLEKYGVVFSCCRDGPHARGFNPRLRLLRTKTLMEGADCCDFRYRLSSDCS